MGIKANFHGAVYGLITNEKNEVLLLKRQNTGYYDKYYALPAGHIDERELSEEALIREIQEEIGITIQKEDIKPIAILQRIINGGYFDIGYHINKREGNIQNNELEKASELNRFGESNLPENITPDSKKIIDHYFKSGTKLEYYTCRQD